MKIDKDPFEVVISGVGGYFATTRNLEEFKEALLKNETLLSTRWPEGELGVPNALGTNPDIDKFDTSYFGIHREQCNYMDPMQRLVLERTFEALIDAGVSPAEIRGKKVAVFTGSSVGENDNVFYESIVSGFGVTGHSRSMMSNRVSYWLNLKGPSCAYDSNWLNGMEVIQAGFDAVKQGLCESAIVATANLALHSEISWLYNDMGLLSQDGITKSFDADAHGYARADGIIVLFLQRACDAKKSYATILGVNSRFYGNQPGPYRNADADAFEHFINDFYDEVEVDPKEVEFVECYGSGNKKVDKAELDAIDKVYCKNRKSPLLVGSVKPNTGHAEASAVMVSLAKVLIAMETGIIPATINYEKPNPEISSLVDGRIEVVNKNREWNGDLAAVSGIGLCSSYGHILLKGNPSIRKHTFDGIPRLIGISTRTENGIQDILTSLKSEKLDLEYIKLIQDTFKNTISGHLYRGYALLDGTEDSKTESDFHPGNKRPIWFVYSGMGSQWCKMACDLMKLPIFAESIHRSHKILEPRGVNLLKIVTEDDDKMFENILHSFVGIAAMQIALTDILKALKIEPDGIIGHSVGELGCAYADGCLTAEQMIMSAYSRGKASLDANLIKGMMAAVGMGYQQLKDQCPPSIEVACHNGADSSTISGPTEDMEVFVEELKAKNIFARLVNVSNIAYHSKYIKPAAPFLLKYLKEVIPEPLPRTSKWISTSIAEELWDTELAKTSSPEYHTNNLLSSVLFEEGSRHVPKDAIVIEIAPHGLLQAILKRSLNKGCTNVPLTLKGNKNGLSFLLSALGRLFVSGVDLELSSIYPYIPYPVSRGTKSLTPLIHWEHGEKWRSGIEDKKSFTTAILEINISLKSEKFRELVGHKVKNTVVIPSSYYISCVYEVLINYKAKPDAVAIFENLEFKKPVFITKHGNVSLHIMVQKGSGYFEISSNNELIVTGSVRVPEVEKLFLEVASVEFNDQATRLSASDIYNEFYHRNYKYGSGYKHVKNIVLNDNDSLTTIQWNNKWSNLLEGMFQQSIFRKGEREQRALKINAVQKIVYSPELLPGENEDAEVSYNYNTNILTTKGLQIFGIETKPYYIDTEVTTFSCLELTPLSNSVYKTIETALTIGYQLVIDNFDQPFESILVVELESSNGSLKDNITNVVSKYTATNANVATVKDLNLILVTQTEPLFIVYNDYINESCVKFVASTHGFLLVKTDEKLLSYEEIAQVAQIYVQNVSYSLVRKSNLEAPIIVNVKTDVLTAKDLLRENVAWVNSVKNALLKHHDKFIYVNFTVMPTEGILNFYDEVQTIENLRNVRFVFALGKPVPDFVPNNPTYKQIIKSNLKLTVIKNGLLNTYISTPIKLVDPESEFAQTASNVVSNTRIEYISVNVLDETIIKGNVVEPQLGNIDYSGNNGSGKEIMGLALLDDELNRLVPDPILNWNIPSRWTLEDGSTVPHAYTTAYYGLVYLGRIQPHEIVLIHGGCTGIGLAAISVARSFGCEVFTTVTSNTQRAYLKKLYSFLHDRNILNALDISFEPLLRETTGGIGAHLILNCLSGRMLNATLRCVADFGKILQLGKLDVDQNNPIGSFMFLRNVTMAGLSPENVFSLPPETKKLLQEMVYEGIEKAVVRPLYRQSTSEQDIEGILKKLKEFNNIGKIVVKITDSLPIDKLNVGKSSQYIVDSKNSYLIYGGTAEAWTDVVEWLVFRGARKIVVASDLKPQQICIVRRLELLKKYYGVNVTLASTKAGNRDGALELVSEVKSQGNVGIVLVLPNKSSSTKSSDVKAVQYLDQALRNVDPKAILVNFLANAEGVCQIRSDAGYQVNHIQMTNSVEFLLALQNLDAILRYRASHVHISDEQLSSDEIEESPQSLYKKLVHLLPSSLAEIKSETSLSTKQTDFVQFPSLCSRFVREVCPVFVIPGFLGKNAVKNLASKMLHPVYCANYPIENVPFQQTASILAQRIKELYPKGPCNIIAVSCGGPLAIKVARILEKEGRITQSFFIDAAPDTLQGIIRNLGEGANGEISFLCRILNLTDPNIVKELSNLSDWKSKVDFILKHYKCDEEDHDLLRKTLTTFKHFLDNVASFQPSEGLLEGQLILLRPFGANKDDECGLQKYCKREADVYVIDGTHSTILQQKILANTINNKILCDT